ncbi:hypothetical protein TCAL_17018 [Tigriopus californicus]|uniref:Uncharacterized protein n=1 Tax=Tigriopus californicus TaxID=6832 RepID=A0A553PHM8_TIGCA|nr:hypothetical protein TCAL_17018 [Tigriopus californicus]
MTEFKNHPESRDPTPAETRVESDSGRKPTLKPRACSPWSELIATKEALQRSMLFEKYSEKQNGIPDFLNILRIHHRFSNHLNGLEVIDFF